MSNPEILEHWSKTGEVRSSTHKTWGGYLFDTGDYNVPLLAVRGVLGLVTAPRLSSVAPFADRVVCDVCWSEWIATPPWNDTPPTLKVPPTCSHNSETEADDAS